MGGSPAFEAIGIKIEAAEVEVDGVMEVDPIAIAFWRVS